MGVREHVSRTQAGAAHAVQFFDSEDTRYESVARFLAEGLRRRSPIIVIARPLNAAGILDCLGKDSTTIQRDIAAGRIIVLDAADTLRRLSRTGVPDAAQFDDVVGTLVARTSRHGRVYAYGEMVDILAQRGDFADARLLEDLWNRLLGRIQVSLLCGYAAAHFVSPASHAMLRDLCGAHSTVHVEPQDPLAAWLLAMAAAVEGS